MKKKGFTLIELIAVLVIMAIIALIVTPLVLNIINKAKDSANKRSIDAYGKSIELSIATYMLDHKTYPTSIDELTIEYSGNEVECKTKQINEDGSIYLTECSVDKKEVKDKNQEDGYYHYGKSVTYQSYKIGDEVTYNEMKFYVITDSDENSDYVTLLKSEPIATNELKSIIKSTELKNDVFDKNGYGKVSYSAVESCGYMNGTFGYNNCTNDYEISSIKQILNVWSNKNLNQNDLKEDNLGYKIRLITFDELTTNLGYEKKNQGTIFPSTNGDNTPEWIYNSRYDYWTMSQSNDTNAYIWSVNYIGYLNTDTVFRAYVVRPVINLLKSAIR